MQAFRVDDLPIESGMLTDALDNAQRKVEAYFFDIRKQLWEYDQARAPTALLLPCFLIAESATRRPPLRPCFCSNWPAESLQMPAHCLP